MIDRTAVTTGLDDAIFTTHWVNLTAGGTSAGAMDHAARVAATNLLKTFWSGPAGIVPHISHAFREVRWYDIPDTAPHKPVMLETITTGAPPGILGSSSGLLLPTQDAFSITFKTDSRKHWGRFYLPGVTATSMDSTAYGTIKTSICDTLATAALALTARTSGAGAPALIVWSHTLGQALTPTYVQVDNVCDIQRKRRLKHATYKKALVVV
jgi:hypothetical protein